MPWLSRRHPFARRLTRPSGRRFGSHPPAADAQRPLAALIAERRLRDHLLPGMLEEQPDQVLLDGQPVATLAIIGYRRDLPINWLAPLWAAGIPVRVSLHLHPIATAAAIRATQTRRGELQASDRAALADDRLTATAEQLAAQDNADLEAALESGSERLFDVSCYLTVTARTSPELEARQVALEAVLGQMGLRSVRLRHAQLPGLLASLPLGQDSPRRTHPMTASAIAAVFPFATVGASGGGVVLGIDPYGGGLVELHPFDRAARQGGAAGGSAGAAPNDHLVILGVSGGGKSLLAKLIALRALPLQANPRAPERTECWFVDRDGEYRALANLVDGRIITLAPGPHGAGLNPLELPRPAGAADQALGDGEAGSEPPRRGVPATPIAERLVRVAGLIGLLAGHDGSLTPRERATVERAIRAAYRQAGITDDARTHARPAPTLATVQEILSAGDAEANDLAYRLEPYTHGAFAGVFGRRAETPIDGRVISWDVQHLADDPRLEAAGLYLLSDALWTAARRFPRPRLVIVDEAWKLIQHEAGGRLLADLVARGRKYGLAVVVITQHVRALIDNPFGYTLCVNAGRKILLPQDAASLPPLVELFGLGSGEQQLLRTTEPGRALLLAGEERRAVQILPSPAEYAVITTDPAELAARQAAQRAGRSSAGDGLPPPLTSRMHGEEAAR